MVIASAPHQVSLQHKRNLSSKYRHDRAVIRMEGGTRLKPSLQTTLSGLIVLQSTTTLSSMFSSGTLTIWGVALNLGFLGWAAFNLATSFGLGVKRIDYAGLDGFDVDSLARQSGEWALAGEVPMRSKDGRFEIATFAGGCFWGTELHFQRIPGVVASCVGYTQGALEAPTYEQVCSGMTGHTEGIQILYDPDVVSFQALCEKLLSTIDPTLLNRVGNDRGTQYRHGIYPHSDAQAEVATRSIEREQMKHSSPVVTEVKPAAIFWPAENYHQRYLQKGGQSAEKDCQERVRCYG
eukprot:CAMPEP_0119318110 /NCGR_PEP_ID=MMETSP1333-20130426/45451_1 /TAXON_ID=418940 /ORGANISM="Scyphosphaera apsteinii, Strain RCC1455" /LENGTH=293 /DNA_ID=CAMNT_0007324225 /DNA_START=139 /DNA_END=1020 /DNA_ORIENTATION=+